jgi:hypothetical protein
MSMAIKEKLLEQVNTLPENMQRRVLDFAQALAMSTPKGVPGKQLLKFTGGISAEDARQMMKAVEEGCEKA